MVEHIVWYTFHKGKAKSTKGSHLKDAKILEVILFVSTQKQKMSTQKYCFDLCMMLYIYLGLHVINLNNIAVMVHRCVML